MTGIAANVEAVGITGMWVVTALRAPGAAQSSRAFHLWLAVGTASVAMTVQLGPVQTLMQWLLGSSHAVELAGNMFGLVAASAILSFVCTVANRREAIRTLYLFAAITMAVLLLIDAYSPPHDHHTLPASGPGANSASVTYWLVWLGYNLVANAIGVGLCWRYHSVRPLSVRIGLYFFGFGMLFAGVLMTLSIVNIFHPYSLCLVLTRLVATLEASSYAVGSIIPLGFDLYVYCSNLSTLLILRPLWKDVARAAPNIEGSLGDLDAGDKLWSRCSPLHFSLYRRIIEIRDSIFLIQPRITRETVESATRYSLSIRIPGGDRQTFVAACCIAAACRIGTSDNDPAESPDLRLLSGGPDFLSEVTLLRKIARHYRTAAVSRFGATAGPQESIVKSAKSKPGETTQDTRTSSSDAGLPDCHSSAGTKA